MRVLTPSLHDCVQAYIILFNKTFIFTGRIEHYFSGILPPVELQNIKKNRMVNNYNDFRRNNTIIVLSHRTLEIWILRQYLNN